MSRKKNIKKENEEYVDSSKENNNSEEVNGESNLNEEEIDSNLDATKEELEEDSEDNYEELYNQKLKEIEDLNNSYLRLKADFTNYKNRVQKEKEAIYAYAAEEIITELLGVIDNFERALDSVDEGQKESSLYQGVEMIYNQLMLALTKAGLNEIDALNQKFDPNLHHGVAQEESGDHDEDTILEIFQKGYKLKEKVIRPSMVKISK
ncbi:nucleotide exchange factor GrpE [Sporosalibacterium faouarense]|uniref:nucleotide exchange factor GrpE n=1 Tax=Sporosalibacterium faouarense TaxID=516123 RepID=UPI00141C2623|nr:nucleotide exchange factor GrpE [Sporosalibacterium faouarense]MTI49383.1 nucleotide exchange factor GrpE [Bacillota bacterium]